MAMPLAFGAVFLALLSLATSANRMSIACVTIPIAVCFYFLSPSRQRQVWFAAIPWLILLNLIPSQSDGTATMPFYHSEAVLLLMGAVLALNLGEPPVDTVFAQRLVAGFAIWITVAALAGVSTSGWDTALSAMRMGVLALLTFRIASEGASQLSVFAGSVTAFVAIFGAIAGFEALCNSDPYFYRSVGRLVGGSEILAIHLSLYLPLALGYCFANPSRKSAVQVGVWVAVLFGFCGLVLSYSRSGWVGGLAGSCFVLGSCWQYSLLRTVSGIRLVGAVAILCIVVIFVATTTRISGWSDLLIARLSSLATFSVLADRTPAWSVAVATIRDSPIFGDLRIPNCYNLFLGIASRAGLPALLLWLGAFLVSSKHMLHFSRQTIDEPLTVGLAGALIAFLITGIGESSLGEWVSPVFFTILGFTAASAAACALQTEPLASSPRLLPD